MCPDSIGQSITNKVLVLLLHIVPGTPIIKIARTINMTGSHTFHLVKLMEQKKMLTLAKLGRRFEIGLTPKGEQMRRAATILLNGWKDE